jgi:adenylylsulfate kinase
LVVWVIGLSGAGKTTLANRIVELARVNRTVVLIDGDVIREVFGNDLGYCVSDRRANARRISKLCLFLESQGVAVVCAVLAISVKDRRWNRVHFKSYFEVYIEAPMEELISRDSKGLYKKALAGELRDVVGVDIPFDPATDSDLVIQNCSSLRSLLSHASVVAELISEA